MRRALRVVAYVWASPGTLVGLLLVATAWSRPRVREGVLDVVGCRGFCALHRRMGFGAITLGHVVIRSLPCPLGGPAPSAATHAPAAGLWAHEMVHVRQWELLGPLMLALYPLASLAGYRRNPFEVWARRRSES